MRKKNRWFGIVAVMHHCGRRLELVKGRLCWFVLVDEVPAHPNRTLSADTAAEWWDMADIKIGRRPSIDNPPAVAG